MAREGLKWDNLGADWLERKGMSRGIWSLGENGSKN